MDFSLTADQLALQAGVTEFAASLNDGVVERDRESVFPTDAWKRCAEFGLQSMAAPAAYNTTGLDVDLVTAAVAMEAFGSGCRDNGLSFALATHMWTVQHPINAFGTDEQKQRYLPAMCSGDVVGAHAITEPDAGSDHISIRMRAVPVDGGYRLSGTKRYITLGPVADVVLVFATIDPGKGRWGLTAFLVDTDTPGCDTSVSMEKMGVRSAPMGDVVLDDCFVAESNRLGPEGAGASISSGSLGVERCFILATHVGAMARQLDDSIAFVKQRQQFGRHVGSFQSVSNRIADMKLSLESSRLLLYKVAWMLENDEPVALEAALLKLQLSEAFVGTSLAAIRNQGGAGYLTETGTERDLRDAIGGLIYAGTSDIQRVLVARMLGL